MNAPTHTLFASVQQVTPVLGRLLIAVLFIPAGLSKITKFAATAGYMSSKGLPASEVLLVLTIIIELGGGIMILLGWRAAEAALVIALFLIPVTVIFHGFWGIEDAKMMTTQQHMFMKNVAIIGGLFCLSGLGSGPFSLRKATPS